jgi:hypothetical protein
MGKIGFLAKWIQLVMKCVRTAIYSKLMNRQPYGHIHPSRGISQGDSLSLYLFLLCAKGLSHLLYKAEQELYITGLAISEEDQRSAIFSLQMTVLSSCKASAQEWGKIQVLLESYERALGQN